MSNKIRLDVAVFEKGLAESREKAKAMIMAGCVYVKGNKELKAGAFVSPEDSIEVRGSVNPIDVGYGQLAWKLRTDERVVNLERTNFRHVTREQIPDEIDFASVDVSFISLSLILPVMAGLLKDTGRSVCLIKPQFEAGKENVGKKGVVRDKSVHENVINTVFGYAVDAGFNVLELDYSPVKGPEGNIEYLMYIEKSSSPEILWQGSIHDTVEQSHISLDK